MHAAPIGTLRQGPALLSTCRHAEPAKNAQTAPEVVLLVLGVALLLLLVRGALEADSLCVGQQDVTRRIASINTHRRV
jgi:hypothetical protein